MKLFDHTVMAHSDTEEVYETTDPILKQLNLTDALGDTETYEKTIHSGQFMISHVHDETVSEREKELVDELAPTKKESTEYVCDSGKVSSIDNSFTKLFQCMSLVEKYFSTSGKLTSPKWKNFKGIKFRLKEKVRVNNIIWREWHMQYVKSLTPILCHFSSPLADGSEVGGCIVDGMYWKRNLKTITNDYKKWRHYFNKKILEKNGGSDVLSSKSTYCEILQRTSENNSKRLTNLGGIVKKPLYQNPPGQLLMDDDDMLSYFSDDHFLNEFLMEGSNLKEIPAFSDENFNDMIQDSCMMDTLEPLSNFFRYESLNFNSKANSTQSVQAPTTLTNGFVDGQGVCGQGGTRMHGLNLLNSDDTLMNLTSDLTVAASPMEDKPSGYAQIPSSDQLLSLLVSQQQLNEASALGNMKQSLAEVPAQIDGMQLKNEFVVDTLFSLPSNPIPNFNLDVQSSTDIIMSGRDPPPDNFVRVLYTQNDSNDYRAEQGSRSMPLLTGLLQQHKQPVIIQLPPGYQIIMPQDIVSQGKVSLDGSAVTHSAILNDASATKSSNQLGSRSLGCLQAVQKLKEQEKCRQNFSTGSLAFKTSVGFRVPQQQVKCRQKISNVVHIQPRPSSSSSPALQSSCIKRLLLPSASALPLQPRPTGVGSSDRFVSLNSQENGRDFASQFTSGRLNAGVEKKRRLKNENSPSSAVTGSQGNQTSINHFNSIFQPINPIAGNVLPSTVNVAAFNATKTFAGSEQSAEVSHGGSSSKYSLDPGVNVGLRASVFGDEGCQLFRVPDRSRHASNDSASSHCDDGCNFMMGSNKYISKDSRRISHITSEQKRRFSIKCGLDSLNELVPSLDAKSGSRISKATTLRKAVEFCRKLKAEKQELQEEIERARNEMHGYELAIKNVHSQMPVQGLPSGSRTHVNQFKSWFQEFILQRSQDNWKYWIFGSMIEPMFTSFEVAVSTCNVEQFRHSLLKWLCDHCSLIILRPIVSNSLRKLSTSTCILVDPDGFRQEVVEKINNSLTQNSLQL